MAPTLLCALTGFVWKKLDRPFDTAMVTSLIMHVGAPCLIISTLSQLDISASQLLDFGLLTFACLASAGILALIAIKTARLDPGIYSVPLIFGNHGNMGLPLCLFAFGETGLGLAVIYFTVISFFHYTIGISVVSRSFSITAVLRSPIIIASVAAVLLIITGLQLPKWILSTLELMGNMTIPLMLIALGVSLASIRVQSLHTHTLLGLVRVGGGMAAGILVAEAFSLEGIARGVIILQSAMPSAIFNFLLAEHYQRSPSDVAGIVVISTLISFAILPFLIPFLLN